MALPKFFHIDDFAVDQLVTLDEAEARHAFSARRLSVGDQIILLNGRGVKAYAQFTVLNKRHAEAKVTSIEESQRPKRKISIAVALPKGDRQKVMLDMLTQLGVDTIIPLNTEFSVTQASDKLLNKLQRVLVEACKQSENAFLPTLLPAMKLEECIKSDLWLNSTVYYADYTGEPIIKADDSKEQSILVAIGPEGGFSEGEIEQIYKAQAKGLRVGENILRTETAAVAAVSKLTY